MKTYLSMFSLKLPVYLVYMLQQVEYEPKKFVEWIRALVGSRKNIKSVMYRKTLVFTPKSVALLVSSYLLVVFLFLVVLFVEQVDDPALLIASMFVMLILLPVILIIFLSAQAAIAYELVIKPARKKKIAESKKIFSAHSGIKIAVMGSYGKTTIKELLNTVIEQGMKVSSTKGNLNVASSHAKFAKSLSGHEQVLVLEFGEGEPGDISSMASMFGPDYAIIAGLAPNHLDKYKSLDNVAKDFMSIYDFVDKDKVFVSGDSNSLSSYIRPGMQIYDQKHVMGWNISNVSVSVRGLSFTMKRGSETMNITSGLVGRHQVSPLAMVAALSREIGLNINQIETGIAITTPYDHRMQPRNMSGAWVFDDTYNGNIEGMLAGLNLLNELDFARKWYVTPGLVDQGEKTKEVHETLGKKIGEVSPDIVVLIENSTTPIIVDAMHKAGFKGDLHIESRPLEFYQSLEHRIAKGDLVMMQNDWTDNYN